jgi:hypothetical protein
MQYDESHGSPYDRGAADAYYGRTENPHKRVFNKKVGIFFTEVKILCPEEMSAYFAGFTQQVDRKIWE